MTFLKKRDWNGLVIIISIFIICNHSRLSLPLSPLVAGSALILKFPLRIRFLPFFFYARQSFVQLAQRRHNPNKWHWCAVMTSGGIPSDSSCVWRLTHIERSVMGEAAEDRWAKGAARRLPDPIASVLSFHDTTQKIDLLSSHSGREREKERERERGDGLTTFVDLCLRRC